MIIINMPPKATLRFVCTDRTPLVQGEIRDRPGRCFSKGLKAGFAAGLRKGQEGQAPMGQPPQPPPAQPPQPPADGDIYNFIDEFVRGTERRNAVPEQIPRQPAVAVFQPQADDIYQVIDDFVRGTEQIARPRVQIVFEEEGTRRAMEQGLEEQRTQASERLRQRLEERRRARAVQVAPPMQIPPAPIVPMFEPIEEEPVPAPMAEEPELPRVRREGRRQKFREFYGLDKEEEKKAEEPPKKIVLAEIKNLLGKQNYKEFKQLAKEDADRRGRKIQDVYDKYGIIELKLLAQVMKDKLDLSADNDAKLTQIIEDKRKQGNKAALKGLMDSVVRSLLKTQGRGIGQSKITPTSVMNDVDMLNEFIRMEEGRRDFAQALYDRTGAQRYLNQVQESNRLLATYRARLARLQTGIARTA